MKVQLIVVQGKPEGKIIPLALPVFKIGRGETCNLRPNSDQVSREHAEFQVTAAQVSVRDLGSRNGTLVNGKAITEPHVLKDRDLVTIGLLTFAVSIQDAPVVASKPTTTAPPPASPRTASPDDVSHDDIESWLVADSASPQPDRPSGVYKGETITVAAFKEPAPVVPAPAPVVPAPAPVVSAPAPVVPAPAPVVPAPAPVVPAPAPVALAPAPAPPAPAPATPAPAPPSVTAPPRPAVAATGPPAIEADEYERLPEGAGDPEPDLEDEDEDGDEILDASEGPTEEYADESNPFYVKKKPKEAETASSKPVYKDSSDAASDILRKMMERRRSR